LGKNKVIRTTILKSRGGLLGKTANETRDYSAKAKNTKKREDRHGVRRSVPKKRRKKHSVKPEKEKTGTTYRDSKCFFHGTA